MRIGFLSDLHCEDRRGDMLDVLCAVARRQRLDCLVLGGDIAAGADDTLRFCDALSAALPAQLRIVAGNHDLYVDHRGKTAAEIRAASAAFYARITYESAYSLYLHPIVSAGWYVCGLGGWYDYTFAPRYGKRDTARLARSRTARWFWSDNRRIRGRAFDHRLDEARVEEDLRNLGRLFAAPEAEGRRICAVTHMLPTRDLLPFPTLPVSRHFAPLLGSERYRTLYEASGVSLSISGHTHIPRRITRNGITYANVSIPPRLLWRHPLSPERELERVMYVLEG